MKRQSFISGAFLLALAVGLGKIFSAVFKIPLDRFFLHADGMAIFNTSYNIYMFFFAIATAGVPMAISSLIAASGEKREEDSIISTALISLQFLMTISAVVIFIFAPAIAKFAEIEEATIPLRVMSPALLVIAPIAAFRGYFQGKLYMSPSALSQLTDSFARLIFGFIGAFITMNSALHICAGTALSGVPLGAFLSAAVLLFFFFKSKSTLSFSFSLKIFKKLLFLSIPITLTVSLHAIFNMTDTISVVSALSLFKYPTPQTSFGCLSRAATLYALPVSIAGAVSSGILPSVSDHIKEGNFTLLSKDCSMAIRLALCVSVPCAAGFMALGEDILMLLFNNSYNYMTLVLIAPSAILLSLGSTQCAILQGMNKTKYSFISALLALTAKIVLNPVLMYFMGVNGAALSTTCAYLIFVVLLTIFTRVYTNLRYKVCDVFIKPFICGILCFGTAFLLKNLLPVYITILFAAVVYIPSLFMTKFISRDEIVQIFAGS